MKFKIGDRVQTTSKHDERYGFSFEGKIDDILSKIVIVYGNVTDGLGKSNDEYLRPLPIPELELYDEWFEEVCGTCQREKLVHVDMRDTLGDPGFICRKCEEDRQDFEKFMEHMLFEDLGVN